MEPLALFVGYLALYRLLIFVAGILSIVCGYRLFVLGMGHGMDMHDARREETTTADFKTGTITLRNIAPGTAFALFGAVMVASMALHSPPEVTLDSLEKDGTKMRAELRGEEKPSRSAASALERLNGGDKTAAKEIAYQAAQDLAPQLNDISWVMVKTGSDPSLARKLAETAVAISSNKASFLDTLSEAYLAAGEPKSAQETLARAAAMDSKYESKFQELKNLTSK